MKYAIDVWKGGRDSWKLLTPILYVVQSPPVLTRVAQCLAINGALFIGSIVFFNGVIERLLRPLSGLFGTYFEALVEHVYYICWLYPVYIISFVLTTLWVQDIFDAAFKHFYKGKAASVSKPLTMAQFAAYMVKRFVMISFFLVQCSLLSYLPYGIGRVLEAMHYSLLYSYYCFEYITMALNRGLAESVEIFEYNWSYFLGFGASFTAAVILCPGIMSSGIFCLFFPFLVLTSIPAEVDLTKRTGLRLPIFTLCLRITNFCVAIFF